MTEYDLTTESGLDKAKKLIKEFLKSNPIVMVYELLDDCLNGNNPEKQSKAVSEIIKAAAASDVEEIKITLENLKGIKILIPIDDAKADAHVGVDGKLHLHVKFPKK